MLVELRNFHRGIPFQISMRYGIVSVLRPVFDDVSRSLLSMELPLGVVTSIMGAPFFIYLIIKRKERA